MEKVACPFFLTNQGMMKDEIANALVNDYKRKLITYKLVDEKFRKKYGVDFSAFEKRNIVKEST